MFGAMAFKARAARIIADPIRSASMPIEVGQKIPTATLNVLRDSVQPITTDELFGGRKVLLFSVPGAFTPTCSARHLPGYIEHFQGFADRGITVACMAVNDAFVMEAWGRSVGAPQGLLMLADGNAAFARALGLELDASAHGMGVRSKRFALYAEDGVVKHLEVDGPGEFRVSSAEHMLTLLG
jgi:glutaredoxin/glutathione-dependent peroxiredoxin